MMDVRGLACQAAYTNGLLFSDPPLPFPLVQTSFPRPVSSDPFLLQLSGWLPISIQSEDQGGETCRGEFITFLKY